MFFKFTGQQSLNDLIRFIGIRPTIDGTHEQNMYYIYDAHNYSINEKYYLALYANRPDGSKLVLLVDGIDIFVDVDVSNEALASKSAKSYEVIQAKPFKGYQAEKSDYLRVYFGTLAARDKFVKTVRSTRQPVFGCTAANSYCYNVARRYNIKLVGWSAIDHMTKYSDPLKHFDVPAFIVNVSDIRDVPPKKRNTPLLMMGWDIETKTSEIYAGVPAPDDPYSEVKQISMTFAWLGSTSATTFSLVSFVNDYKDSKVITCSSQYSMLVAFGAILKQMCPDIITDFNGFKYDWPFVISKAKKYFMPYMGGTTASVYDYIMNCAKIFRGDNGLSGFNSMSGISSADTRPRKIKLSADITENYTFIRVPGKLSIDIRVAAARLTDGYMPFESQSLNYYLTKNRLPQKVDMDYRYMDSIFALHHAYPNCKMSSKHLSSITDTLTLDELRQSEYADFNKLRVKEECYKLADKSRDEIIAMLNDTNKIIEYCDYDAYSTILLFNKLKIIQTYESLCNLAFVPLENAAYNAGGSRVCNHTFHTCHKLGYLVDEQFKPESTPKKYDGAYYPKPKIGLFADYPVGDVDVNSEYPNVASAYNLSPEMCILDASQMYEMRAVGMDVLEIKYKYGLPGTDRPTFTTWFLQFDKSVKISGHLSEDNRPKNMGIFPIILRRLYDTRRHMVKTGQSIEKILAILAKLPKDQHINHFLQLLDTDEYRPYKKELLEANLDDLIEDLTWMVQNFGVLQLGRKIMMNTFYGTAGSKTSCLFMLQVSGSITSKSRDITRTIERVGIEHAYEVVYGDTDSIYVIPPKHLFEDTIIAYNYRAITREQYWSHMVDIGIKGLDTLSKIVNVRLQEMTQTDFVQVSFERVMFPTLICGLKYYMGASFEPHKRSLDLVTATSNKEFEQQAFSNGRLHLRGQLIKKTSNAFSRDFAISFLRRIFNINGASDLMSALEDTIKDMNFYITLNTREDADKYVMRAKYKKNKSATFHIARFVENMKIIKQSIPTLDVPILGEQFKYLNVRMPQDYLKKYNKADNYVTVNDLFNTSLLAYYGIDRFDLNVEAYFKSIMSAAAKLTFSDKRFLNPELEKIDFSEQGDLFRSEMSKNVKVTTKTLMAEFIRYVPTATLPKTVLADQLRATFFEYHRNHQVSNLVLNISLMAFEKGIGTTWRRLASIVRKGIKAIPKKIMCLPPKPVMLDMGRIHRLSNTTKRVLQAYWNHLGDMRARQSMHLSIDTEAIISRGLIDLLDEYANKLYNVAAITYVASHFSARVYSKIQEELK